MPKRKAQVLHSLGFEFLPGRDGLPDTFKCFCGDMKQFCDYRDALNHSYKCEACKQRRPSVPINPGRESSMCM